ncbi:MAG: hypothetical protein IPP74_14355 [Alphaproteobacteria bacterium]|nr:hypothetical protein [Alphaproteobacteria bacterium]
MSTSILQEFLIKIGVDVNKSQLTSVDAALSKAGASAAVMDKEVTAAANSIDTRLSPALKALFSPLTVITAAVGLAYDKMFNFVKESAEGFEQISRLANRVNTTADSIKKLGYIAQFTGSSVEAAQGSLDGLNRAAGLAALGLGRAKKVFGEIGVNIKNSNGKLKDTTQLLFEIGEHIKGMERGKQLAVLSRLGIDPTLINALTTDVSKFGNEYDAVMKKLGLDNNKAAESGVKFAEALKKIGTLWGFIKDVIAASFFDQFTKGFDSFSAALINNLPKIISIMKPLIASMIKIAQVALKIGVIFATIAAPILDTIVAIDNATDGWVVKIVGLIYALRKLNLVFVALSANPFTLVIAGIGALIVAGYELYKNWDEISKKFKVIFGDLANWFKSTWSAVYDWFSNIFGKISNEIKTVVDKTESFAKSLNILPGVSIGGATPLSTKLAPSAQANSGNQNKNVTINNTNKTDINVNSSGSPYEVALAVKNQQTAIYGDQIRNMQGAVR